EFYWNRDLLKKSIKADNYIENKFEETRGYYKLNLEFPQYTKGFHWLLKARCGYKLDTFELNCSSFNDIRNDIINNLDIVHSFFNSDSRNVNSENFGNISGNNSSEIGKCSKVFNFLPSWWTSSANDPISVDTHATERNRKTLSGNQTQ
ncbi:hypothetical protein PIROE2DRAFT_18257, partial [Piromyces sp. E2]